MEKSRRLFRVSTKRTSVCTLRRNQTSTNLIGLVQRRRIVTRGSFYDVLDLRVSFTYKDYLSGSWLSSNSGAERKGGRQTDDLRPSKSSTLLEKVSKQKSYHRSRRERVSIRDLYLFNIKTIIFNKFDKVTRVLWSPGDLFDFLFNIKPLEVYYSVWFT